MRRQGGRWSLFNLCTSPMFFFIGNVFVTPCLGYLMYATIIMFPMMDVEQVLGDIIAVVMVSNRSVNKNAHKYLVKLDKTWRKD